MPGPSGLDLQEAFAKSGDAVPIVFLSGHGDIRTSVRAIKAGAVDFLTKPVEKHALLSAVESALNRDQHNRSDLAKLNDLGARYKSLTPRESEVFSRGEVVLAQHPRAHLRTEGGLSAAARVRVLSGDRQIARGKPEPLAIDLLEGPLERAVIDGRVDGFCRLNVQPLVHPRIVVENP